jgi:hypothetical protein
MTEPSEPPTESLPESSSEALGEPLRTYAVDTRRRWIHAIGFGVLGALLVAVGIPTAINYVADANASGYSIVPGALLGLGCTLLGVGVVRLAQSVTRPDEHFVLHQDGFVQHSRRGDRAVAAADVIGLRRVGQDRGSGIVHSLGLDFRGTVITRTQGRVTINTYTEDAERLAAAIAEQARAHRPAPITETATTDEPSTDEPSTDEPT